MSNPNVPIDPLTGVPLRKLRTWADVQWRRGPAPATQPVIIPVTETPELQPDHYANTSLANDGTPQALANDGTPQAPIVPPVELDARGHPKPRSLRTWDNVIWKK